MDVANILSWIRLLAQVILDALDEAGIPPSPWEEGEESAPEMKPERIQIWLRLIARFVLAVFAGASGETGKSGEGSGAAPKVSDW